jgi:hypothetical protein
VPLAMPCLNRFASNNGPDILPTCATQYSP